MAESSGAGGGLPAFGSDCCRLSLAFHQLAELATHFAHEGRHFETLARLGDADMGALHRALASQNEGLEHLTKILQRDERDLEIVLREAMAQHPSLRVVLMSATLDAERFSSYFGGVNGGAPSPVLTIPGRTFPIVDYFLEDAIERSGYVAKGKMLLKGEAAEEELAPLATEEEAAATTADGDEGGAGGKRKLPSWANPKELMSQLQRQHNPTRGDDVFGQQVRVRARGS